MAYLLGIVTREGRRGLSPPPRSQASPRDPGVGSTVNLSFLIVSSPLRGSLLSVGLTPIPSRSGYSWMLTAIALLALRV